MRRQDLSVLAVHKILPANNVEKIGAVGQDLTETDFATDFLDRWERGVPLVLVGFIDEKAAERRRMDELVEQIVCQKAWKLAA